jgi:hypothetical protein
MIWAAIAFIWLVAIFFIWAVVHGAEKQRRAEIAFKNYAYRYSKKLCR